MLFSVVALFANEIRETVKRRFGCITVYAKAANAKAFAAFLHRKGYCDGQFPT